MSGSDEELMAQVKTVENEDAFAELYRRYNRMVMGFFNRMLNFPEGIEAEDLTQELFLRVFRYRHTFQQHMSFRSWLFAGAYNICKNTYRHQTVTDSYRENYRNIDAERLCSDVDNSYDTTLFEQRLQQCLSELPSEQRAAFILHYQEELSLVEVARIQLCSEGTVKSRLYAAVKYLSERLKEYV